MEDDSGASALIKAAHASGGSLCTPAGEVSVAHVVLARVAAGLLKAAEDQARDENGRFASGGGSESSAPDEPVSMRADEGFGPEHAIPRPPASAVASGKAGAGRHDIGAKVAVNGRPVEVIGYKRGERGTYRVKDEKGRESWADASTITARKGS